MPHLFNAALRTRKPLKIGDTSALRIIDGEGDGLPGTYLETFSDHWLLSTASDHLPGALRTWLQQSEKSVYWKKLDQHEKESPTHLSGPPQDEPFVIRENGLRYQISFQSGYSQGIFLDQRDNRLRIRKLCQSGHTVLNTFAYTGAFSVAATAGGATTTTLDLSQPYLDWARDNMRLNSIDPEQHYFIKGDTFHWLRRFAKQGRRFNGIILDPPSFSRDDKGKVFRAETDYGHLAELAASCLHPGGWLLCTTNHRGISPRNFLQTVRAALPHSADLQTFPMPPDFNGDPYLKSILAAV